MGVDLAKLLDELEQALPELKKAAGVEEDSESPDEESSEDDGGEMPPPDDSGLPGMPPLTKKPAPF